MPGPGWCSLAGYSLVYIPEIKRRGCLERLIRVIKKFIRLIF